MFLSRLVAVLAALLVPVYVGATTIYTGGGGGGGPTPILFSQLPTCTATLKGVSFTLKDCTGANDCSAGGGVAVETVNCDGLGTWNIQGDGTAGAGDGVPAGSGTELQLRQNATTFQAAAGTSYAGGTITAGNGATITTSGTGAINATTLANSEQGIGYDAPNDMWFTDVDKDGVYDYADGDSWLGTDQKGFCVPTALTGAAIQACLDAVEAADGGTVQLLNGTYTLTDALSISDTGDCVDGSCEIVLAGSGMNATLLSCTGSCTSTTAALVIDADNATIRDLSLLADRDATALDGIWIGDGTLTARDVTIERVNVLGDSGDAAGSRASVGILSRSIGSNILDSKVKWFQDCVRYTATAGVTTSNGVVFENSDLSNCDMGINTTAGVYAADSSDLHLLRVTGSIIESIYNHGIHLVGTGANGAHMLPNILVENTWFETMDTGIYCEGNVSAAQPHDCHITSINSRYVVFADTAGDADALEGAIIADSNADARIISIGDTFNGTGAGDTCINHQGTSGDVILLGPQTGDQVCTPTVSSAAIVRNYDNAAFVQRDATDCTNNNGNLNELCLETDASTLYVCGTSPKCAGSGWVAFGGGGSGDNVSVDGVGVTDPNFASTGDIDFVDTANVVTGNINASAVAAAELADPITWSNGDLIDFSAIDCDAATCDTASPSEGLKLPQHATNCADITGEGVLCWGTSTDTLYVGNGASATAFSAGGWTDTGTEIEEATVADEVLIGTATATDSAKLTVTSGDADQVKSIVVTNAGDAANAKQFVVDNAGTDVFYVDKEGDVTAESFTALPSATPTIAFDDDVVADTGYEARIVADAVAANNGRIILQVENNVDDTYTTGLTVSSTAGVVTGSLGVPFSVDASDSADAGALRLDNAENICWEASPAGTDVCFGADASEIIQITGGTLDGADIADTTVTAAELGTDSVAADEIAASAVGTSEVNDNTLTATDLADNLDFGGDTTLEIPNAAAPSVTVFGQVAADNNLWAAGRGTVVTYDGTAAVAAVMTLVSDTPGNGQVPKWNTGGTITWEPDADTGGAPALSNVTAPVADATFAFDATEELTFNFTGAFGAVDNVTISQNTGNPTAGSMLSVEAGDANVSPIAKVENTAAVTIPIGLQIAATDAGGVLTTALDLSDAEVVTAIALGANDITTAGGTISQAEIDILQDGLIGAAELTGAFVDDAADVAADVIGASELAESMNFNPTGTWDFSAGIATFAANEIVSSELAIEVRSMYWGAGSISSDGTNCANPTESANILVKQYTIVCADSDAAIIYGSTQMPDGWNGGTVVFTLVVAQVGASTNGIELDFAAKCVSNDEALSAFGTPPTGEQAAAITLTADNDILEDDTAAVTVDGTTCAAGDVLFWTGQVDATASHADIATAVEILGVKMEYTTNIGD